jgi:uncharacterized membrane protein YuzA (DUF378 family)
MKTKWMKKTAEVLLVAGALVWGLTLFSINPVTMIASALNLAWISTLVYALVGVSGVYGLVKLFK